jgi:hypothetical protein
MRVSYRTDAAFLLRLQTAVSKDTRRSAEWVADVMRCLNQVSKRLLEAEAENLASEDRGRRGRKSAA